MKNDKAMQECKPNLYETLYDLSRFMTGELRGTPSDPADTIISVAIVKGDLLVTTCDGAWRFRPARDGNSTIELISHF